VSGAATGRLAACVRESATLVSYGRMSGEPCAVQPDAFVFRDLTLRGFWLVNWFRRTPEHERRVLVDELAGLIASGVLHAPIHATYDVSEIREAVASAAGGSARERSSSCRAGELSPGAAALLACVLDHQTRLSFGGRCHLPKASITRRAVADAEDCCCPVIKFPSRTAWAL